MIKLDEDQVRMIYLIARLKIEYIIEAAAKKHNGLSSCDEAAGLIHDLESAGLIDATIMNGKYWEPNHKRIAEKKSEGES